MFFFLLSFRHRCQTKQHTLVMLCVCFLDLWVCVCAFFCGLLARVLTIHCIIFFLFRFILFFFPNVWWHCFSVFKQHYLLYWLASNLIVIFFYFCVLFFVVVVVACTIRSQDWIVDKINLYFEWKHEIRRYIVSNESTIGFHTCTIIRFYLFMLLFFNCKKSLKIEVLPFLLIRGRYEGHSQPFMLKIDLTKCDRDYNASNFGQLWMAIDLNFAAWWWLWHTNYSEVNGNLSSRIYRHQYSDSTTCIIVHGAKCWDEHELVSVCPTLPFHCFIKRRTSFHPHSVVPIWIWSIYFETAALLPFYQFVVCHVIYFLHHRNESQLVLLIIKAIFIGPHSISISASLTLSFSLSFSLCIFVSFPHSFSHFLFLALSFIRH